MEHVYDRQTWRLTKIIKYNENAFISEERSFFPRHSLCSRQSILPHIIKTFWNWSNLFGYIWNEWCSFYYLFIVSLSKRLKIVYKRNKNHYLLCCLYPFYSSFFLSRTRILYFSLFSLTCFARRVGPSLLVIALHCLFVTVFVAN